MKSFLQLLPVHFYKLAVSLLVVVLPLTIHSQEQVMLFDFGGSDAQTSPPAEFWNNVTEDIGSAIFSVVDLIDTEGGDTGIQLFIDEVFDIEPNQSGSESAGDFPSTMSSDSLVSSFGTATFALVGEPGSSETFDFTFYASDTTSTDNRETRYTVSGNSSESVDLNPSGNMDTTAMITGMGFNDGGEIILNLSPGPNHTSGNSLVYIGGLLIQSSEGWSANIDFGSGQRSTVVVGGGPTLAWNNVTNGVANTDAEILVDIQATDGSVSSMALQMVSRFNGVNTNGTRDSGLYPESATQDSWYANTEEFGGLSDVTPVFKMTGLDPDTAYDFTFFASRMGVGDNRETLYTVTGATVQETTLNAANNISETTRVEGVMPNALGEISIALLPGPNNNNGNHFIYLNVMQIDLPSDGLTYLFDFGGGAITEIEVEDSGDSWNNITESIGQTDNGNLNRLVNTEGLPTQIRLEMVARFNGVNRNGSLDSTVFPVSATQDSLFGNTGVFSGLSEVFPVFKLTGLNPENAYSFTFYGSRSATDNRETRYTVSGSNSKFGDLNAASNVDDVAVVDGIMPNASGEITVSMGPGPNNNNGSLFTYLGVMRMEWVRSFVPRILIDAGGINFPTSAADDTQVWNNFQGSVGQTDNGVLPDLITVNGTSTRIGIEMLARFNGVNEAGTMEVAPYPSNATRDSLFGNTEEWSGLIDIFPSFKLTGLNAEVAYDLTFYASRNATDNRETQYDVSGANEATVFLNVAGNIDQTAVANDILPATDGTITVSLSPGPNNNNANHFTYLGVLQLDWEGGLPPSTEPEIITLTEVGLVEGVLGFILNGRPGETYTIQGTSDFLEWTDEQSITLNRDSATVEVNVGQGNRFFRLTR